MHIRSQNPLRVPQSLPQPVDRSPSRVPAVTAQDLVLLDNIKTQENIMRLSQGVPWASALAGAAATYYMADHTLMLANHSLSLSGFVGLPVGLLLGAGLAEYLSSQAYDKMQTAQAELSCNQQAP